MKFFAVDLPFSFDTHLKITVLVDLFRTVLVDLYRDGTRVNCSREGGAEGKANSRVKGRV